MRTLTNNILCQLKKYNNDIRLTKQFIYDERENLKSLYEEEDVSNDTSIEVITGLYHRYPSKVLIFPTESCFGECRFCFRKYIRKNSVLSDEEFDRIVNYISNHSIINEVIFSGGDPMTIDNNRLFKMVEKIRQIKTIKYIRIHTRVLTYEPNRINDEFVEFVRHNQPLFMVFHINSFLEISDVARERVAALVDNGIPCFSQTALLHEVNDTFDDLKELYETLLEIRIKPYYLFHPDMVKGNDHFYVSIEKGIDLYKRLYNSISGLAMPIYLLNISGGGGHCIMDLGNVQRNKDGNFIITDWENKTHILKEK